MGRRRTDLRERILGAADRLFYTRGYPGTGVSEIVAEAGTNKPGLYSYFPGKEDLAREYVRARNEAMMQRIAALGDEAEDICDFFRRWVADFRRETRAGGGSRNGCAVANFAHQTDSHDEEMLEFVRGLGKRWVAGLTAYIRAGVRSGRFPATPGAGQIARRMLVCHEGALTMWKLTGSERFFQEAGDLFEQWYLNARTS